MADDAIASSTPGLLHAALSRAAFERLQAELADLTGRGRVEIARKIEIGPRAGRPLRERRLPRRQGGAGEDGGPHPPPRGPDRAAEIVEDAGAGVVQAGSVVEIRYEGDDAAERYLLGSIEERHDELEVISPGSPLGQALIGAKAGRRRRLRGAERRVLKVEVVTVE